MKKRFLSVAKWVPAMLWGLLVVAWLASAFYLIRIVVPLPHFQIVAIRGSLALLAGQDRKEWYFGYREYYSSEQEKMPLYGHGYWFSDGKFWKPTIGKYWELCIPIPLLLTLALPPAIAPFNRLRYPLWSYFVFVAIIAGELAFYLAPYSGK